MVSVGSVAPDFRGAGCRLRGHDLVDPARLENSGQGGGFPFSVSLSFEAAFGDQPIFAPGLEAVRDRSGMTAFPRSGRHMVAQLAPRHAGKEDVRT